MGSRYTPTACRRNILPFFASYRKNQHSRKYWRRMNGHAQGLRITTRKDTGVCQLLAWLSRNSRCFTANGTIIQLYIILSKLIFAFFIQFRFAQSVSALFLYMYLYPFQSSSYSPISSFLVEIPRKDILAMLFFSASCGSSSFLLRTPEVKSCYLFNLCFQYYQLFLNPLIFLRAYLYSFSALFFVLL